jgi:hypothetical protein
LRIWTDIDTDIDIDIEIEIEREISNVNEYEVRYLRGTEIDREISLERFGKF